MTIKQIQHLLAYLGYYTLAVDGISGPGTKAAVTAFQAVAGLAEDGIPGEDTCQALRQAVAEDRLAQKEDPWAKAPHFTRAEFACKCGCGLDRVDPELVRLAEQVRQHFDAPVTVSSGLRCERRNKEVGGVANSRHMSGKAMDFRVSGQPGWKVLAFVRTLPIRYAYAIDGSYVHMDVR